MIVPNNVLFAVVILSFVFSSYADKNNNSSFIEEDDVDTREMREYTPESWHAVQTISEGATGWIPSDSVDNSGTASTKRRRLRKRKRRPPIVSYLDQNAEQVAPSFEQETYKPRAEERVEVKKRKIPNIGDPWAELQEESMRPYVRRKVTPVYHYETSDNLNRESTSASSTPATSGLKEILKQNGGLSLSEILQRKNITLAELLMGKKEAIKALTESSEIVPSITHEGPYLDASETTKYIRLPPSIALRKEAINRRYEQYAASFESLSEKETLDAQRKRLALLQGNHNKNGQNGKFSEVTRYEIITEPTTEKRIFVPSYIGNTEPPITEVNTPTSTIYRTKPTSQAPKLSPTKAKLPLTSAKLMKMTTKKATASTKVASTTETLVTEEENYPKITGLLLKPLKISIKEVSGFQSSENQLEDSTPDEPLRMSIDLDSILVNSTRNITSTGLPVTSEAPKLEPYTAEEEISEILRDPQGKAGLARILEARNMTIRELIEQRERGSSQLHLADIFHNKTKEPEPLEVPFEGKISSEVFTSFPVFGRQPKGLLLSQQSTASEKPLQEEGGLLATAFPSFKIEINKDKMAAFPWQQIYSDLFHIPDQNKEKISDPLMKTADILTEEDIQRLEDIDQRLFSSMSNSQLNTMEENAQKTLNVSSGIKSAIIASLVIVLLSMILFVTILLVFRWTQKKKMRLNYVDSLKPPLFEVKPKSIKTFVAETLNKKKVNYYKRHLQSMSDDSWEGDNERKNGF